MYIIVLFHYYHGEIVWTCHVQILTESFSYLSQQYQWKRHESIIFEVWGCANGVIDTMSELILKEPRSKFSRVRYNYLRANTV